MSKIILKSLIFTICILLLSGCNLFKKGTGNKDTTSKNDTIKFVTKDPVTGKDKVKLKYALSKGDKFNYKSMVYNSVSEKDVASNQEAVQEKDNTYYYTTEVTDVDQSGITTYMVKFDSITMKFKVDTVTVNYNSNVKDTSQIVLPVILVYNALINNNFYMRVSPLGEISDIYGLEKVYENFFHSIGDTLKDDEKAQVQQSFGKDFFAEIIQQQFQYFPKQEVVVDSSWVRSSKTQMPYTIVLTDKVHQAQYPLTAEFDVSYNTRYTLTGVENKNEHTFVNVEGGLSLDFLNKEVNQKGYIFTVENAETNGNGKISVDLNRGCVVSKQTTTSIKMGFKVASGGQSKKSIETEITRVNIQLMN